MTSADVDFYGQRAQAETFAARLDDARIYLPGPDDHTPHAAIVIGTIGERRIQIDFMHTVLGVDHRSIENNFITLTGAHRVTGKPISILVLHPLDCLRSRLSNVNDLRREDAHSISSGRAAILVLDAFIDELLEQGEVKEAQSTLHGLYFVVRGSCLGKPSFTKFGLDPRPFMRCYLEDTRLDERWRRFNLSNTLRRLDERETRLRNRTGHTEPPNRQS